MGTASKNRDATFSRSYICIFSIVSDSNFDVLRCVMINSIIQICKIKKETVIWVMSTFIFFELGMFSPKSEMYVYSYLHMHDYTYQESSSYFMHGECFTQG